MDIEGALKTGFGRTKAKNGLILIVIFFAINLVSTIASQTRTAQMIRNFEEMPFFSDFGPGQGFADPGSLPLAFESLPASLISLMTLGASIAGVVVAIVAFRVFASDAHDEIPGEAYSNLLMPTINGIIGGIVFAIVVGIGFILLVIPGIYLLVSLAFFLIFIALEDDNFIEALQSSWGLTKGRRLSVFLLFVALFVVGIVISIVGSIAGGAVGVASGTLGAVVNVAFGAVLNVFALAVLVNAYSQLREEQGSATGTGVGTGESPAEQGEAAG